MIKLKRLFIISLICLSLIFLFSCYSVKTDVISGDHDSSEYSLESSPIDKIMGDYDDIYSETFGDNEIQTQPHQLSAAAYDDNKHFDFWLSLLKKGQSNKTNGLFSSYFKSFNKSFNLEYRLRLYFKDIIPYCVKLINENQEIEFSAVPTKDGYVSLFSTSYKEEYYVEIDYFDETGTPTVLKETITGDKEYELTGQNKFINSIDLMFVIDTTGSMGDEIKFLKSELSNVIQKVSNECENVLIRLSLLVYRDEYDEYITRYSDFSTDIDNNLEFLNNQYAAGGGDFEEAVDKAFEEALSKNWSTDLNTKIIVFVADAPAHDNKVAKWAEQLTKATQLGIRVITVASSGIDKKTEYFFRCGSLMTGGIYTYLTDDSGIGGQHLEPTVEEKPIVEFLDDMLVRLIVGYHTGCFAEPISYKKIMEESQNVSSSGLLE